jgi:hypothetical protein
MLAKKRKYELPAFLKNRISQEQYDRWLHRRAKPHARSDSAKTGKSITISDCKRRIHDAVCSSDGIDWYTAEPLHWERVSKYDNAASKAGRSKYKAEVALLPTVDHVWESDGSYQFVICGWRTNDAKGDLSLPELVNFCQLILARHNTTNQ